MQKKQYVGEVENPLHLGPSGHRSDYYRNLPDKPVRIHFNRPGHTFGDPTIKVIEQMCMASAACRKSWKSFWIHTLQSLTLPGLN